MGLPGLAPSCAPGPLKPEPRLIRSSGTRAKGMPNETTTCDIGNTAFGETPSARTAGADAKARPAQDRVPGRRTPARTRRTPVRTMNHRQREESDVAADRCPTRHSGPWAAARVVVSAAVRPNTRADAMPPVWRPGATGRPCPSRPREALSRTCRRRGRPSCSNRRLTCLSGRAWGGSFIRRVMVVRAVAVGGLR